MAEERTLGSPSIDEGGLQMGWGEKDRQAREEEIQSGFRKPRR